ncbi:MAG: dihydroneopterin aldolase [Methylococcales bacterium]|nr:dihydroneopterin aldolase [Methylococcales bacterium]MDD5754025.1 dihydroneopterin aldolase [Methylococcales bacterium]
MTDIIFLRDVHIDTLIGIFDWEREAKQTLIFDIEMAFDCQPAGESDDISNALNYKAVFDRVTEFVEQSEFFLIEKLAAEMIRLIQTEFGVSWVKLTVNKKGAVGADINVGVIMERGIR